MRRGDLVTVALQSDYGKPRPALVIQSALFDGHPSVTILPITSALVDAPLFRLSVDPTPGNGLRKRSQVMIDKVQTIARDKIGEAFGRLEDESMLAVNRAFLLWIGLA
ncbi:type II toxin-antitoxin system PemK/MazF family toxin [Azospirillum sp. CT11-132]|uniref:type II toxin-antitoxin system PemK/MazF family toxin n=1 Tax=Azospirillum sp. CT11-132 TaxID=3396317 RepID=UPI0039A410B5